MSSRLPEWESYPLSMCLSAIVDYRGKSVPKSDSGIQLITARNVRDGVLDLTHTEYVPEHLYYEWMDRGFPNSGDILFTTEAPLGMVAAYPETGKFALGQRLIALRTNPARLHAGYLLQFLLSAVGKRRVLTLATGSTAIGIRQSELKKLQVPVPPLPEQRKIAEILGTWDAASGRVEQLIAALQRRKQGLMQRLLTGAVRFPEFGGTEWEEKELSEVVEPISRPETVEPGKEYRLIGVRWYLEGAHVHDTVSGDSFVSQSLSRIEENDILYNKMWVSKAAFAVAKPEHAGAYVTGEYPQFRAKAGLDARFLAYAFHVPRFQHDATALCRGTTGRIRLHPRDFLQLKISLPSLAEQHKIAEFFFTVDKEITLQQQRLAKLQVQKKGLMQRLLTGQVRVKVDSVTPAA